MVIIKLLSLKNEKIIKFLKNYLYLMLATSYLFDLIKKLNNILT